jgi:hypothetical protein
VIDELMGHHTGRPREQDGSAIGLRYRHMTTEMQARVLAVIDRCLATALAVHAPTMPQGGGEDTEGQGK